MDFFDKKEIESDISRIDEILGSCIFNPENSRNVLLKSAFIEVMICLRDLMYKTQKYSSRVSFSDDVLIEGRVKDVTDLIEYIRNTICHIDSDNHFIEKDNFKFSFCVSYGKVNIMSIGELKLSSDYEDDLCFFFGKQKIYLKRHIVRAFEEGKEKLLPFVK